MYYAIPTPYKTLACTSAHPWADHPYNNSMEHTHIYTVAACGLPNLATRSMPHTRPHNRPMEHTQLYIVSAYEPLINTGNT